MPEGSKLSRMLIAAGNPNHRGMIRKEIINIKLLPYRCAICGIGPEWQGKPMPLILDHINGINNDHRLENLRFVCSNCDTQLPTYKAKNRVNPQRNQRDTPVFRLHLEALPCYVIVDRICKICGGRTKARNSHCGKCRKIRKPRPTKIQWPDKEELTRMLDENTAEVVAAALGVSGRAVRKRCETRGISLKDRRLVRRVGFEPTTKQV